MKIKIWIIILISILTLLQFIGPCKGSYKLFKSDGAINWCGTFSIILVLDLIIVLTILQITELRKNEYTNIPEFAYSDDDSTIKILIFKFPHLDDGRSDVGLLLNNRFKDLEINERIKLETFYHTGTPPNSINEVESILKDHENLDLIIWGYVMRGQVTDSINLNLNYLFSDRVARGTIQSKYSNSYQMVSLMDMVDGFTQEYIDCIIYYFTGVLQSLNQDYKSALENFSIAELKCPIELSQIYLWKGFCYFKLKKYDRAIYFWQLAEIKVGKSDNSNVINLIYYSLGYFNLKITKDFDKSKLYFQKALNYDKKDISTIFGLIAALEACNDYLEVEKILLEALNEFPDNDRFYFHLSQAYHKLKNYDKAVVNIKKAININSNHADYYYTLALNYEFLDKTKKSLSNYKRALKIDPYHPFSNINYGIYVRDSLKNYKSSINFFLNALKGDSSEINAMVPLAYTYNTMGQIPNAINIYIDILKIDSNNIIANYSLARIYENYEGKQYLSEMFYRELINIEPNNIGFRYDFIKYLMKVKKDYTGAVRECNKTLDINSDFPELYLYKSIAYMGLVDKNRCRKYYKIYQEFNPDFSNKRIEKFINHK